MSEAFDPAEFSGPIDPDNFELWFGGERFDRVAAFGGYTLFVISHTLNMYVPACPTNRGLLEQTNQSILEDRTLQVRTRRQRATIRSAVNQGFALLDKKHPVPQGIISRIARLQEIEANERQYLFYYTNLLKRISEHMRKHSDDEMPDRH